MNDADFNVGAGISGTLRLDGNTGTKADDRRPNCFLRILKYLGHTSWLRQNCCADRPLSVWSKINSCQSSLLRRAFIKPPLCWRLYIRLKSISAAGCGWGGAYKEAGNSLMKYSVRFWLKDGGLNYILDKLILIREMCAKLNAIIMANSS
jgi:hypothetical protein